MPKPKADEEKDDFISRFMADKAMLKEYPDQKQRAAVAYSTWKRSKSASSQSADNFSDSELLSELNGIAPEFSSFWSAALSSEFTDVEGDLDSKGPVTSGRGGIEPGQEQVAPGEVRVDLEQKEVSPENVIGLHGVDVKFMNELESKIIKDGFLKEHPPLYVDTPLGHLVLDGHHRSFVAKKLKLKTIPALVAPWAKFLSLLLMRFGNALPKKARYLDKYLYADGKPYDKRAVGNGHSKSGSGSGADKSTWGSPSAWARPASNASSERFTCLCICSVVEKSIEFCGKTYVPDQAKAYVVATMLTSLPAYTKTRRAWTAATIANSATSAQDQIVDREHRLKFYEALRGATSDDLVGHIVDWDFPAKKKAIELAADGDGVPFKVLLCLGRKVQGVEDMLQEIPRGVWKLSQECEYLRETSAFYDTVDKKFFPYADCSAEMKAILKSKTVEDWKGHPMLFCPGGENGEVLFSGCAMTRWPLDVTAQTESLAASEEPEARREVAGFNRREQMILTKLFQSLTCAEAWRGEDAPDDLFAYVPPEARGKNGKKSLRKFPLASKSRKGLDPAILRNALARFSQAELPAGAKAGVKSKILAAIRRWNAAHDSEKIEVSEKSGGNDFEVCSNLFAGCTMAAEKFAGTDDGTAEKHQHAILSNGLVMPHNGHSHGLEILGIDLGEGTLDAVTTSAYDYLTQPAVPGEACSSARSKSYEHRHIVRLTKDSVSSDTDVTGALTTAVSCPACSSSTSGCGKALTMKIQEMCAGLRSSAAKVKDKDAEIAAVLEQQAADLEKEVSADNVEIAIAAKLKDGSLFTKEVHEQAVSAAKQAGKDELHKEISAKEVAAKAQAEVIKSRLASVVSAGLKPETVLGKDKTIQSAVSAMPVGADGDKLFADRLEEWIALKPVSGKKDQQTSADQPEAATHALGTASGGNTQTAKTPNTSMGLL